MLFCTCADSLFLYLFNSPSGCTFWGKKPWSRKKKILWQVGTLIGAPLGIALAASVVLPAMLIGVPVYVGRQVRFHSIIYQLLQNQYSDNCIVVFINL